MYINNDSKLKKTVEKSVGLRMHDLIQSLEMNQKKFCDYTGILPATISSIVSGRNLPRFETLKKITEKFPMISLRWFITGEGEMFEISIMKKSKPDEKDFTLKRHLLKKYLDDKMKRQKMEAEVIRIAWEMLK